METSKYLNEVNDCITSHYQHLPTCSSPGDRLRIQRIRDKWYDPSNLQEKQRELRDAALRKFKDHIAKAPPTLGALEAFTTAACLGGLEGEQREVGMVLVKASNILRRWCATYSICLNPEKTFVGPGMNAAYNGWRDELSKLVRSDRWPVQRQAKGLLYRVARSNRLLRMKCMTVGRKISWHTGVGFTARTLFDMGFEALTKRKLGEYDTITTVPKNNKSDRTIAMTLIGDQMAESAVAFGVEKVLNDVGCFLANDSSGFDGQYYHGKLISDPRVATIDFSSASDSNYFSVIEFMLKDTKLLKDLEKVRVRNVNIESCSYAVPMLATMGRRICFVVMTLILAALGCAVTGRMSVDRSDPLSPQVYGDDVIIPNPRAHLFIEAAGMLGYKVNKSKTFINSPFRESCGKFYHDDQGYIVSFDFKPAENIETATALTNKALLNYIESTESSAQGFWYSLWEALFNLSEKSRRGPIPVVPEQELGSWVFDPDFEQNCSNKQVAWLADCLQTPELYLITCNAEKLAVKDPKGYIRWFQNLLSFRDARRYLSVVERVTSTEQVIVGPGGERYGTLRNLRRLRSTVIKYERANAEAKNLALTRLVSLISFAATLRT